MGVVSEFMEFLREYKVLALAIAFIIGAASTTLIKSVVDNVIMPLIDPLLPAGGWKTTTFAFGSFKIGWGAFLADLINFVIIAFVVFIIAKKVLKEEKVTKK